MMREGRTERLILRPLEVADAAQMQVSFPHWPIVRYLKKRVPWPYPPNGALTFCREVALPQMRSGEGWHWSLRLVEQPDQLIGSINLRRAGTGNRGFWLGLPWQGRGLMSEACAWVNNYWFEELRFPVLRVSKAAENAASRRISEKQGMRLVGRVEREYLSGWLPTEIWEITAEEWQAWKTAHSG